MKALGFWTLLPFCLRWKNEEWTGKIHTGTETLINMEGWPLGRLFTGVSVGFFSGCVFMKFSSPFKAKVFYSFIIPYTRAKYKFFVEISQEFNADSRHLIAFHQEKLYNR